MPDLPTGTITILFTDLVDHSSLYARLGQGEARSVILSHFRVLRGVVAEHGGHEVKEEGDRLMVAFGSAGAALHAAIAMQQSVARANQAQPRQSLSMRVGLNAGEPVQDNGDLYGTPVIVAGRLCDQAQGGEILVSEVVKLLAGPRATLRYSPERVLELKGVDEPVRSYSLLWEEEVPTPVHGRSAFVGRQRERALLMERLDAARQGHGSLVVVAGEPGIGKTRLALEVATAARSLACRSFSGQAYDMKGMPPYLLFTEALRGYLDACDPNTLRQAIDGHLPALGRLFPSLRSGFDASESVVSFRAADNEYAAGSYPILEALNSLLGAVAQEAPVVLFLDELQWADQESLQAIQHLARDLASRPVLMLGAYRPGEVDQAHPLGRMLADLGRRRLYQLVSLAPLNRAESVTLIAGLLKTSPAPGVASSILHQTEGNPFFIEEVVADLLDRGYNLTDPDVARDHWPIPDSLRQLLGARLSRLDQDTLDLLTAASILGDPFNFEELRAFSNAEPDQLVDALDAAIVAGVVRESGDAYEFSHALIGETLLSSLTTPRFQRLHLRAARALEERAGDRLDEWIAEVAYHYRQAGPLADPAIVVERCRRAGDLAISVLAYDRALEHYQAAVAAGTRVPQASPLVTAALQAQIGHAHRGRGAWDDALASYSIVAEAYRAAGDSVHLAEALYYRARVHLRRSDYAAALGDLGAAGSLIGPEQPALLSSIREQEAQNFVLARRHADAERASREALELAERAGSDELIGEALFAAGLGHLFNLRMHEAAAAFRRARSLSQPAGVGPEFWDIASATRGAIALTSLGELDEAAAWVGEEIEFLGGVENPYQRAWAQITLSALACLRGDFAVAESHAADGLAPRQGQNQIASVFLLLQLTQGALMRSDLEGAEKWSSLLQVADNRAGRPDATSGGWGYPLLVRAARGELEAVHSALPALSTRFSPRRPDVINLIFHVAIAELALQLREPRLAALPYASLAGLYQSGMLFTLGWCALLPRMLGGLAALQGDLRTAERYLGEALAVATRLGAAPEIARTHLEYAWLAHGRPGGEDRGAVLLHLKSADTLATPLGMEGIRPSIDRLLDAIAPVSATVPPAAVQPPCQPSR